VTHPTKFMQLQYAQMVILEFEIFAALPKVNAAYRNAALLGRDLEKVVRLN